MSVALRSSLCQFLIACCLGIAACGGGGDDEGDGSASGTGELMISISGLPSGTSAAITVLGPGEFRQTLTQPSTLTLAPGSYTVVAANVLTSSGLLQPQPPSQTVGVAAGARALANVIYGPPEM
ncbi:hypothetical protein Tamer19_21100 [Cupriavidus sp. TA19]|uniref:hypothetical protein n=1 Tax=unclassified Cupriavidus TaxID=2640874 RepID=UPI000ED1F0D6|nr:MULTISPECIES: hypothetical protein [unclassified Cupriavidus]BDB26690.1 hypothetical protein CTP10_R40950 [Cupriavidus sp. P-10]GLC92702.1 hypothetical protein Tamer19_21100 [Cupriavidus sp. TA19]